MGCPLRKCVQPFVRPLPGVQSWATCHPTQGVIYPVSHRSFWIEFGGTAKQLRIAERKSANRKKIKRETVQPCIANGDRSRLPAIIIRLHAAPARGRKRLAAPVSAQAQRVCWWRLITTPSTDSERDNFFRKYIYICKKKKKKKSSSHSLLLRIVTTRGFPDVSTHVHSFHERRGAPFCVSQARCTQRVASLWRVDEGQEQSNLLPCLLQA